MTKMQVYGDGASLETMVALLDKGLATGFTTNPTLMVKAGVKEYESFCRKVLEKITTAPISFEVFSDEFDGMRAQARKIASWGKNVNVKIPIMNTKGSMAIPVIRDLLADGVKLNVTAVFTNEQMQSLREILKPQDDVIVSVFAGRIADTGRDPMPIMRDAVKLYKDLPGSKVLWASPREVLNAHQAEECGCHIITMTEDLIKKYHQLRNKSLHEFSQETVQMFYDDAKRANYEL